MGFLLSVGTFTNASSGNGASLFHIGYRAGEGVAFDLCYIGALVNWYMTRKGDEDDSE